MKYRKDLSHLTSIRLSSNLRDESNDHAKFRGISFSEFVRNSLKQNINHSKSVEGFAEETSRLTLGRTHDR
jgi:hypothetical protein